MHQPMASKDPRTDESVMVATTEVPLEFQEYQERLRKRAGIVPGRQPSKWGNSEC
jgi:hypothetical protein